MYGRKFSRIYNEFGWNYYPEAFAGQLLRWIEKRKPDTARVLDLGCGTGVLVRILREAGIEAHGVDLSEDMIAIARREDPDGRYETADMTSFEPDGRYDIVTCTGDALNHLMRIEEVEKTFRQVFGYLEDGGFLIFDLLNEREVSEPEPITFQYDEKTDASFLMTKDDEGTVTLRISVKEEDAPAVQEEIRERLYDPEAVCRLLERTGFTGIRCTHRFPEEEGETVQTWYVTAQKPTRKGEKQMIRNFVFDIGGVLADFRVKEFLAEKGFDGPMIKRILKASFMSPYWEQFERGELTEEETLQGFTGQDPEIAEELRKAFSSVAGMLTSRAYAIPLVKELKANGYGVYYLSNYSKKAYDECGSSLAFMPYMDGGLVSFRVGKTKPDPKMYEMFLGEYGLDAKECAFIDDTEENVKAAEQFGFRGIVFRTPEELVNTFAEMGVIREGSIL